jgi:hypothetical protein
MIRKPSIIISWKAFVRNWPERAVHCTAGSRGKRKFLAHAQYDAIDPRAELAVWPPFF